MSRPSAQEAAAVLEDGLLGLSYNVTVRATRDGFFIRAENSHGTIVASYSISKAGLISIRDEGDLGEELLKKLHLTEFSEEGGAISAAEKEALAFEAGRAFGMSQIESDEFSTFVTGNLIEGEKMSPSEIEKGFETQTVARNKAAAERLARRYLEQLRWDIERNRAYFSRAEVAPLLAEVNLSSDDMRDRNVDLAFWKGARDVLDSSTDSRKWVAETLIQPIAKQILKKRTRA